MKIGIVGGSIAGCSAAILLHNSGYDVTVFERSKKALVGRGGGIGTTPSLLEEIKQDGLISERFAYFQVNSMPLIGKTKQTEPFGRTAWKIPLNFKVFQWNELWKTLRENVPNNIYHAGVQIVDAHKTNDGQVELTSADQTRRKFDLVLFADGYNSFGRSMLFPNKKLKYRGYVLWRGLLPESELSVDCPLSDEILRLSYPNAAGHNVVYFIPNMDGSTKKGERVFNWAAYMAFPEEVLPELLTDKNGMVRTGTLPPGYMQTSIEKKLKDLLCKNSPDFYADMIQKTKDSYIQVIYTLDLDDYYKDNMCLIGDAGMVVQPFTGSGVFKGYHNVKELINCLSEFKNPEDALDVWSKNQVLSGKKLLTLGEQMEQAFIWEQPDFSILEEDAAAKWWKASVTFPDNFNYEKG